MRTEKDPNQTESGPFSKKVPDHVGEKIDLKSADDQHGLYPKSIVIGGEIFEFRHENKDEDNALYIKVLRADRPTITENIIVGSNGIIVDHIIYDQRDEEEAINRI